MMTSFKDQIRFRVPTFRWITYFQWLVAVGWFVSLSLSLIVAYAPATKNCTGSDVCGQWTTAGNVAWEALFRPAWGVWVCWVIVACIAGYGGSIVCF